MSADAPAGPGTDRRTFLRWSGLSVAGAVAAGCGQEPPHGERVVSLDFGRDGDVAVVNYLLVVQEVEAAFYEHVLAAPPHGFAAEELQVFGEIAAHERAHRGFLRAKLGDRAIGPVATHFADVDLHSHEDVLHTAERIETLGVEALNGAAQYVTLDGPLGLEPLTAVGEIVSVEARHAATVADLRRAHRATDEFAPRAFDAAKTPEDVLDEVSTFLSTLVPLIGLPPAEET
ncbi:MAG TPA: ferritin-like domain-containing protein [Solirubrobacteraceae bacterium]|nr:ferritin-like domain-containing protein [Solirubrobacteraceae bacterium]